MKCQALSFKGDYSALAGERLTVRTLLTKFQLPICTTWFLTLCETTLTALVPLYIGFAIDGLLANDISALMSLSGLLGALIFTGLIRRVFDTRAYGTIRVELGKEMVARATKCSVSKTNARLGMGRELVDFLEEQVPQLLGSLVQLSVSLVVLWWFHPMLFISALGAGILILLIYTAVHQRFFRLNGNLNSRMEAQVRILSSISLKRVHTHLTRIRQIAVRISDTEAYVYGLIFAVLFGFILFNLWFASVHLDITFGRIFSIVSYSWEFVESALVLPATLQAWSRLCEIMRRINSPEQKQSNETKGTKGPSVWRPGIHR